MSMGCLSSQISDEYYRYKKKHRTQTYCDIAPRSDGELSQRETNVVCSQGQAQYLCGTTVARLIGAKCPNWKLGRRTIRPLSMVGGTCTRLLLHALHGPTPRCGGRGWLHFCQPQQFPLTEICSHRNYCNRGAIHWYATAVERLLFWLRLAADIVTSTLTVCP